MKSELTDVRGIGPSTVRILEAQGIRSVAALAKAKVDRVPAAPGFGEIRAAEVIAAAKKATSSLGKKKVAAKKLKAKKDKKKKKNGKKKKK